MTLTQMNMNIITSSTTSMKRKRPSGNITDDLETSLPARKIVRVMSALPARLVQRCDSATNPQDYLSSLLSERGVKVQVQSYNAVPSNFFEETREEEINAYDFDVLKAIRESDLEQLRSFHKAGRPLKCSNRFGESLLHLACRKGLVPVVDFLINEVGVPLRVVDDIGRSPLHDAFWTCDPNYELVDLLLNECPDLLYISDKRGHAPLMYARRNDWVKWNKYLQHLPSHMVAPTVIANGQPKQ
jgi:ankyrin repeat protein